MTITFEQAKALLTESQRRELRDHAFGDREVYFSKDGKSVGEGYDGSAGSEVRISHNDMYGTFKGKEGEALIDLGTLAGVERNDSTGPDEFTQGQCMPSLTKEGVLDELVNK